MTTSGWIKLFKDIKYEEGLQTLMLRHIYIACLLDANYKEKKYKGEKIKLGEFTTSYAAFAKRHFITKSGAEKGLKRLEKEGKIGLESTSQRTKITVINYEGRQSRGRSGDDYGDDSGTIRRTTKKKEERNKKKEYKNTTRVESLKTYFPDMSDELSNYFGKFSKKVITEFVETFPQDFFIKEIEEIRKYMESPAGKKKGYKDYPDVLLTLMRGNRNAKRYYESREIEKALNKYR